MKVLEVNRWCHPHVNANYFEIVCDNNKRLHEPVDKILADLRKANRDIDRLVFIKPNIDISLLCRLMLHRSEITIYGGNINSIKLGDTANRILARSLKECR